MNVKWHLPGDGAAGEGLGAGERACFTKQTNPTKAKGESLGFWVGLWAQMLPLQHRDRNRITRKVPKEQWRRLRRRLEN